jgi:hypothetical protein
MHPSKKWVAVAQLKPDQMDATARKYTAKGTPLCGPQHPRPDYGPRVLIATYQEHTNTVDSTQVENHGQPRVKPVSKRQGGEQKQESIAYKDAETVQAQAWRRMRQDTRTSNVVLVLLLTTAAIWEVTYSPPYTNSSRVQKITSRAILFFFKLISLFPERGRSSRSVDIVVPRS